MGADREHVPPPLAVVGVAMGEYQHDEIYPRLERTVPLVTEVVHRIAADSGIITNACGGDLSDALEQLLPDGGLAGKSPWTPPHSIE